MTPADLASLSLSYDVEVTDVLAPRTTRGRSPGAIRTREEAIRRCTVEDRQTYEQTGALLCVSTATVRATLIRLKVPRGTPHALKPPPRALDPLRPGYMLPVVGDRDENCGRYGDCLTVAARYERASCPQPADGDPDGPPKCRWYVETKMRAVDFMRSREA